MLILSKRLTAAKSTEEDLPANENQRWHIIIGMTFALILNGH
jgi:hypothetical protein